jgi:hypothetical protein
MLESNILKVKISTASFSAALRSFAFSCLTATALELALECSQVPLFCVKLDLIGGRVVDLPEDRAAPNGFFEQLLRLMIERGF